MGNQVRLYFGVVYKEERIDRFQTIGMVDLQAVTDQSKVITLFRLYRGNHIPRVYLDSEDGKTKIYSDCIDSPLYAFPAVDMLEALRDDNRKNPYRRYSIAIASLKEAIRVFDNLFVVLFGY